MPLTRITQSDLDVTEWLSRNPEEAEPGSYPKIFYNVNLPPVLVSNEDQEDKIGSAWVPLNVAPVPDVPPVTIDPTSAEYTADGGMGSFTVTITGPGESGTWTVDSDTVALWLHLISPEEPQSADGMVNYTVDANDETAGRTAHFYVNGKTFTVNQAVMAPLRR